MKPAHDNKETDMKDRVSSLYEVMKSEKIEELEIRDEGSYIFLKRKGKMQKHHHSPAQPQPYETGAGDVPADESALPPEAGAAIKSPITGIFYRSPSPSLPAFVKEGDVVGAGKTLCIVEAMKVMNEVKSESGMKILKILVENGKPINASQDLFMVEKL